jgi:hypothetical protein
MRDLWETQCRNALFHERVLAVALHRFQKAEPTVVDDNDRSELWKTIWRRSREHVSNFDSTPAGRSWAGLARYYIIRRVSHIEYTCRQSPGKSSTDGLDQWASRVYDRVMKDSQDQLRAETQAAEQAALMKRLEADAREQERRDLVTAARARRLAEGQVTMRLKKEAREARKRARDLRKDDAILAAEERNTLDTTPERRAEIQKERAEIAMYLTGNTMLQAAKVSISTLDPLTILS